MSFSLPPLTYVLGRELQDRLTSFTGDYDRDYTDARRAEIRARTAERPRDPRRPIDRHHSGRGLWFRPAWRRFQRHRL